ncbi:MAG TPA: hypothetical protein VFG76_12180 [Candidatus Polarisedimenticolia bacterium]|nr:hypothetical protein [Candidatus Polarisedimenticolia bacterium]
MDVQQIAPGLWRWTAPHPEWKPEKDKPGGWGQMVGSIYFEPPPDEPGATVLIDPLAPPIQTPESGRFWTALDADVMGRQLPVAILLGNWYHERSAQEIHDRYERRPGVQIWIHEEARRRVRCPVHHTFTDGQKLPGGVRAQYIGGLDDGETVFHIPTARAIVSADALIGAGDGRVRVAPASWAKETPAGQGRYCAEFRAALTRLLDLPVEMVLVSHGAPVLTDGRRALAEAIDQPAWGE